MATLIRRIVLKNYKSIANCKVDLQDIALLVGPNGSGKSNFIDSLRLISDALDSTLEHAIRQRGGINEVRRRSGGHPTHFSISLRVNLGKGRNGHYALQVGAKQKNDFNVLREQASISTDGLSPAFFDVEGGELVAASAELATKPKISSDRLFLTAVSGELPFRVLFDALSNMQFYSINPDEIKEPQPHDSGERLYNSGSNLAAVIKRIGDEQPELLDRIQAYLKEVVPSIIGVEHRSYGPRESLEFRHRVPGQQHPWRFQAANMSDGTLRSLGVLTALFHQIESGVDTVPLVAIEEPEVTIHPAAASIVMDALIEASTKEQVLATTHSPDLLDHSGVKSEHILAVRSVDGETQISQVDPASVTAIQEELFTPSDLLRLNQLAPETNGAEREITPRDLFA